MSDNFSKWDFSNLNISKLLGLDKLEKVFSRFERLPVKVYEGQCCNLRGGGNCQKCLEVCLPGAISINPVSLDYDKCFDCGLCTNVCPSAVFESSLTDDVILAKTQKVLSRNSAVIFGCQKLKAEENSQDFPEELLIELNCLGRLNLTILLSVAAFGGHYIWINTKFCQDCKVSLSTSYLESLVSQTREVLSCFNSEVDKIVIGSKMPDFLKGDWAEKTGSLADEVGQISRREFFDQVRRQAMAVGIDLVGERINQFFKSSKVQEAVMSYRLPRSRELLLAVINKLGKPRRKKISSLDLPFTQVEISDSCNFCKNCLLFCPTNALIDVKGEGEGRIDFVSAKCTACGLCATVCPTKSISYPEKISSLDLVDTSTRTVARYKIYKCRICQQQFASGSQTDICSFCRLRQEKLQNDFYAV